MRNIVQYPITEEEVLEELENIQIDPMSEGVGSLQPMIRREIKLFVSQQENMQKLLELMKV